MPARAKGLLALFVFGALNVPARAADTTPAATPAAPAAAAPAAAAPTAPSPAAIAAADKILEAIGLKQSIAIVVPGMMQELETNVTRTRPEIRGFAARDFESHSTRIRSDREADLRSGGEPACLANVRAGDHPGRGLLR